jgi:long-chain acyl-CoA synthetase
MAVVAVSDPALNEAAIQAFIRSNMAGYKVPGRVELVDVLPRDDNGKVAKRRLRDSYLTAPVP